jgi:hypothetical protein
VISLSGVCIVVVPIATAVPLLNRIWLSPAVVQSKEINRSCFYKAKNYSSPAIEIPAAPVLGIIP